MYKVYENNKYIYVKNLVRARTCEDPIISDDHENYFFLLKLLFLLKLILKFILKLFLKSLLRVITRVITRVINYSYV